MTETEMVSIAQRTVNELGGNYSVRGARELESGDWVVELARGDDAFELYLDRNEGDAEGWYETFLKGELQAREQS